MKDNLPPEEKLLNLIKGRKKEPSVRLRPESAQARPAEHPETKSEARRSSRPLTGTYFTYRNIRKSILALTGIAFIYLIFTFVYPLLVTEIRLPEISDQRRIEDSELETGKKIKPYDFYQKGMQGRQIFSGSLVQQDSPGASAAEGLDLIKYINLVGIVSGDNPQAIIEDKKVQKTYYVTEGQSIGDMQVEEIKEGLVILSYRGQKYELYL